MLRWWDIHDNRLSQLQRRSVLDSLLQESGRKPVLPKRSMKEISRSWKFCVKAETLPGETMCVTGDCFALGDWKSHAVFPLTKEPDPADEGEVWSGVTHIPGHQDVSYRYCKCVILEPDFERVHSVSVVVRQWETHLRPRVVPKSAGSNMDGAIHEIEKFGVCDRLFKLERGWLTTETVIQLKLYNNPIQLWKHKLEGCKVFVKVTPVNLMKRKTLESSSFIDNVDESMDTQETQDQQSKWPITEIAVMNASECHFKLQEQFGRAYNEDDCMVFNISLCQPESVGYLIDFYMYSSRATVGEPPSQVGFSYILPSIMTLSEGQTIVPITSIKHRPIGQLTVEYTVIKPIDGADCDMSVSYARAWKPSWQGLDVGHRGLGTSFKGETHSTADVRENTIASLKAAASSGADLVEFDVQLSKDLVPVLYHDFHVCIAMKRKKELGEHDMLELPLKDLTIQQLHLLKIYHVDEKTSRKKQFVDEEREEYQPFPTLQQALELLDPHVGFNIEIKWNMQLQDGSYELYHPFDLNMYLDTVLKVVLQYGGYRKIVFSCFHPDICTMIRLKQNKYPVMFLTQGVTSKYPTYLDPRSQTIPMAVYFADSAGILGVSVHTEDILRDTSQVKLVTDAGLVIFCWGDDNNSTDTIKQLKKLGLHGIIYDKIDQYSSKEVKESIFLVEAREAQKQLYKVAAHPTDPVPPPIPSSSEYIMDVEMARKSKAVAVASSVSMEIQKEPEGVVV